MMAEEKSSGPLSDVSNNSFVILGPGSYVSMSNGDVNEKNTKQDMATGDFSYQSVNDCEPGTETFAMTPQEKLKQLLKENYHLKETLSQNNLAIRMQLSTFSMWQQEVLKTHEMHTQKFLETKDLILKLRSENLELKKHLENSSSKSWFSVPNQSLTTSNLSELKECSKCSEKDKECVRIRDLYDKEIEMNESLLGEKNDLQKMIEDSKREISELNKSLNDLRGENERLKQKTCEQPKSLSESFCTSLLPNCEARLQISNLFKQLEEERAKVSHLKEELEKCKACDKSETSKSPTEELTHYLNKLNDMDESLQKQSQRINGLSSWIYLTEETFLKSNNLNKDDDGKIMSEIAKLKTQLNKEENASKEREENLQGMHEQFTKLLKDYRDLQQKFNDIKLNESTLEELKNNVDLLTNNLKIKEEELNVKEKELNALKEAVKKLNLECEEVAILRVQAELYRSDFNEERAAREKLVGEKEEMAERVRSLETIIKDMEREKEQSSLSSSQHESEESTAEVQSPPPKGKKTRYVCPKCTFSFSDLKTCQEHIEDCVNIHFYP